MDMIEEMELKDAEIALLELVQRNPLRHDGHAYELELCLWGLGLAGKPEAEEFGQQSVDMEAAASLALEYAKAG